MKILVACQIDPTAIKALSSANQVILEPYPPPRRFLELMRNVDILVVRSGVAVSKEALGAASRLGLVIRAGSGTDNIDLQALTERGIRLSRISGVSARAVAELGLALLLALSRKILEADRSVRAGEWGKSRFVGKQLEGKTLGVVGAGLTGLAMARICLSLGMEVVACVRRSSPQRVAQMQRDGIRLVSFDEVIRAADVVSVHVPLGKDTRHLFDEQVFARMKDGALLVNLSRGGVVDEAALAAALQKEGGLGGAALDVHEVEGPGMKSPLATTDRVILSPHIGAQTEEVHREVGERVVQAVADFRNQDASDRNNGRGVIHSEPSTEGNSSL